MPTLTLTYQLPDEQREYDRARLGDAAIGILWEVDQLCRSRVKHGDPTPEEAALAEQIRDLIPREMMDV